MSLQCEVGGAGRRAWRMRSRSSLRAVTGLRGEVRLVAPGTLANDGKVIDDRRAPG